MRSNRVGAFDAGVQDGVPKRAGHTRPLFVLGAVDPALAQGAEQPGVSDLGEVITNIRNWLGTFW